MVKKNWFNGLQMPAVAIRRLDGRIDVVRNFSYADFMTNLSLTILQTPNRQRRKMMRKNVLIVGAGGVANVVAHSVR